MTTWNQLPPVVTEGDPNHTAHHNLLRNAAEQLQAEVDAIAAGGGGGGGTGDVTQAELDAAVAPKADKTYVDAQDAALSTDIDGNTAAIGILQTNLNTKASVTYVDAQDSALDTRIDALESGGGATPATVYTSDTEPTGGTYQVGDLWVSDPGGGAAPVLRGMWTGTDWGEPSAYPVDVTYTTDPGRPESVVRNDYVADPQNRDTYQVYSNGELTWWVNEWGGLRIRVAENSPWDAALRLIGANNQSGPMLEVQDASRQNLLMSIASNGAVTAPNVRAPSVVLYGSDPIPVGLLPGTIVARVGGTTARFNYFDRYSEGEASLADGWDSVVGAPPSYAPAYALPGGTLGMRCDMTAAASAPYASYVMEKTPGYINSGYARLRLRTSALANKNARVFMTEASTGGMRHGVRLNTAGKVEIVGYDGTTVLATSTTSYPTNAWFDLGVRWVMGNPGTCEVRIYLNGSETASETVSVTNGNFEGAGGDLWGLRWGLQASNAGTNAVDYGMVAWDREDWLPSAPPEGTTCTFAVYDGSQEVPLEAGGGGGASAVDWINVKASGLVKGDGTTDDTAAIQGVLDAAGVGATIYFPKGIYRVSAPLVPLRQQRLIGCHSPKYDPAEYPTTECAIRATSGFTGTALLQYDTAPGVTLESLCLLGKGQTVSGGLNGIDMGVSTSGEKQWWIKSCSFSAFNGAAITGSMWVGDIRDCHIGRSGYGIKTNGAEAWTDARIIGTQIYFCTSGGIEFDTTKRTGLVTIIGSRVERSGGTYGNPAVPLNTNAFGIRLGNVNNIELIGVSTDACSGPGLWIGTDVTDSSKIVYSVIVTGSEFLRDGGGDQTAGAALPGVRLRGASHVQFVGNTIGYGAHNDSNPGQVSPKFGLELEKATQCQIGYSRVETAVFADSLNIIGTQNYGTAVNLQPHGLFSFPVANEAAQPAKPLTGSSYYSTTDQKPRWWTGSKWVDALNGDGTYAPTLKPGLDLEGPDTLYKSLRYKVGDLVRWVLSLRGSTGSSNFTLDRHDAAGAYVDTPLTVRASDGRIDTNPQYVTAKSPDKIAMEIRPAASPTVSWFKVADSAGVSALEVRYDGEVWVGGAPIAGGDVTKAYVDAADAALQASAESRWKRWTGSQAEYDAISPKDADTLYVVV